MAFCRKAHAPGSLRSRQPGHRRQDVGVLDQFEGGRPTAAVLLQLVLAGRAPAANRPPPPWRRRSRAPGPGAAPRRASGSALLTSIRDHMARRGQMHRARPPGSRGRTASAAARAMAKPILPLEWLVMPRTGSMASKVGPAVTRTLRPGQTPWAGRIRSARRAVPPLPACGRRPLRHRPGHPPPGPSTVTPSALQLRHVATAWRGGSTSRGSWPAPPAAGSARSDAPDTAGSTAHRPGPCASLAMKSALAGATTNGIGMARQVDMGHVGWTRAGPHWLTLNGPIGQAPASSPR